MELFCRYLTLFFYPEAMQGCVVAFVLMTPFGYLSLSEFMEAWMTGMLRGPDWLIAVMLVFTWFTGVKDVLEPIIVLLLAWALGIWPKFLNSDGLEGMLYLTCKPPIFLCISSAASFQFLYFLFLLGVTSVHWFIPKRWLSWVSRLALLREQHLAPWAFYFRLYCSRSWAFADLM